ncbi:conserved hypothetical protein [Candidatus Defluviicoccus seviourii]|uniref:SnoaL-like domain-containing protein n=1 Tax=Candidatus Defluviicoccus seviourii TaxID=2565273 RepID=A0A564WHQ7_9PROT|nr:conserved hypothetical protein [Candidatus Defluviicoccus seviourii]
MSAHSPEEIHLQFAQHFSAGALDQLVALYEPDAVMIPSPGNPVQGLDAIRAALAQFLAMGGTFTLAAATVVRAADLALLYAPWTLQATAADGSAISMTGITSDVARRQADGTWLLVLDNPYGPAGVGLGA